MPDAATYLDHIKSTSTNVLQMTRHVSTNIEEAQERQRIEYRKRKSVSGEKVTFKEDQLVLVYNARKH